MSSDERSRSGERVPAPQASGILRRPLGSQAAPQGTPDGGGATDDFFAETLASVSFPSAVRPAAGTPAPSSAAPASPPRATPPGGSPQRVSVPSSPWAVPASPESAQRSPATTSSPRAAQGASPWSVPADNYQRAPGSPQAQAAAPPQQQPRAAQAPAPWQHPPTQAPPGLGAPAPRQPAPASAPQWAAPAQAAPPRPDARPTHAATQVPAPFGAAPSASAGAPSAPRLPQPGSAPHAYQPGSAPHAYQPAMPAAAVPAGMAPTLPLPAVGAPPRPEAPASPSPHAAHAATMASGLNVGQPTLPPPSRPAFASPPPAQPSHAQPAQQPSHAQALAAPEADFDGVPGYRILRTLGKGGMGEVFLAERVSSEGVNVRCVVKTILPHAVRDQQFRELFLDEARVVALLRHPNIVSVFDCGRAGDRLFQVMEWIEGLDAAGLMKKAEQQTGEIPLRHLIYILRETLAGLHYAHTAVDPNGQPMRIVHRDISQGNILISRQGAVKLSDFGVAVGTVTATAGAAESLAGKPHYFAPELWRGARASAQTDVFALGVTFYEMLTLKPLFSRQKNLHQLAWEIAEFHPRKLIETNLTIPDGIEQIITRSLAPDPKERYASALEFLEDVNDYTYEMGIRLLDAHFARYIEQVLTGGAGGEGRRHLFRGGEDD